MQFIPNGPDIPDALLQAHEDGRVVFFCGGEMTCTLFIMPLSSWARMWQWNTYGPV